MASVVGCFVQLHNYFVNARIDLEEDLANGNGLVETVPGRVIPAPIINKDDSS